MSSISEQPTELLQWHEFPSQKNNPTDDCSYTRMIYLFPNFLAFIKDVRSPINTELQEL
jgi:hypothetical protein